MKTMFGLAGCLVLCVLLSSGTEAAENIMLNPGAEEVIPGEQSVSHGGRTTTTEYVPKDWGLYNSCGYCTWGSTEEEAHSGKRSAFLSFSEVKAKKTHCDLCLGANTNNRIVESAMRCKPDTTYYISFWMKGDLPRIIVFAYGRTEYDERQFIGWVKDAPGEEGNKLSIKPTDGWMKYRGFVTTKPDTYKFWITLSNQQKGRAVGNIIYVDDVVVKEYVKGGEE